MEERKVLPDYNVAAKAKNLLSLHYSVIPRGKLLEINVPPDGNCLFYSVTLAFLLPAIKNKDAFVERFHLLFGKEELITSPDELWNLLQGSDGENYKPSYDGNPQFILDNELQLQLLASTPLRARVVKYMQDNGYAQYLGPTLVQAKVQANLKSKHY